jgi:tape measure domain-containing protein
VARSILVKSERDFDTYDLVFAELFAGAEMFPAEGVVLSEAARQLLEEWLKIPAELAKALGLSEKELRRLSAAELGSISLTG